MRLDEAGSAEALTADWPFSAAPAVGKHILRIPHNFNKKRRLEAPLMKTGTTSFFAGPGESGPFIGAAESLGRLPLELRLQTLHLVFQPQL